MPTRKKSKEQERITQLIITYYCPRCELAFGRAEWSKPYCFYCKQGEGLIEQRREIASKEAIFQHLNATTDRMMENLLKPHTLTKEQWPEDAEREISALRLLASGETLKKKIRKLSVKGKRKSVK